MVRAVSARQMAPRKVRLARILLFGPLPPGRHETGIRNVQQIAIMMGCAVLPHLRNLVACIVHGLQDEQQKVRIITALVPLLKQLPPMVSSL
jgi:hypothetical protein